MGNRVSRAVGCLVPSVSQEEDKGGDRIAVFFPHGEPPDEGLGHSFCYVRPPQSSPTSHSDRFITEARSASFRSTSAIADNNNSRDRTETAAFKSISGASVSANTSTPLTVVGCHDQFHSFANVPDDRHAAFESTASFAALPLQPVPRGASYSGPISGALSGPISGPLQSDHDNSHLQQRGFMSGPLERGLMSSGPLERGFISGPLERSSMSGPIELPATDRYNFSAPISGPYYVRRHRRMKKVSHFFDSVRKPVKVALTRTISSTLARTLAGPVRQFVWRQRQHGLKGDTHTLVYETPSEVRYACSDNYTVENENLQWAQGKAGEDRVHVVVSEEHGWLFVGIYDGFNGPDAPDFLMRNLYRAVYKELQTLLWESRENSDHSSSHDEVNLNSREGPHQSSSQDEGIISLNVRENADVERHEHDNVNPERCISKEANNGVLTRSRTLRELLADADAEAKSEPHAASRYQDSLKYNVPCMNLKRSYSEASSLKSGKLPQGEEAPSSIYKAAGKHSICMNERAVATRTGILKANLLEPGVLDTRLASASTAQSSKPSIGPSFTNRKTGMEAEKKLVSMENDSLIEVKKVAKEDPKQDPKLQRHGDGVVDHDAVLRALARALELTEEAYLAMADCALEDNPEIALMGSCILVALMKDKDVYVLNVGDSRAIVAQERTERHLLSVCSNSDPTKMTSEKDTSINRQDMERISEESRIAVRVSETSSWPLFNSSLYAVQLSTDHSTSIEEEIHRIQAEHPDDNTCIFNDRVKGRLKVTRAFGAGFLKKPRWNRAILEMFQIEYVGSAPYISCIPALHHHRLGPNDRFLILSSDGLYQYFTNQEVVSYVEWFMEKFPEGDPAQYLIEELLFRAARKAGMDFHDLLDIPQGDRRKYHDDVSVMIVTIDGKIWKCSG